MRRRFLVRMTWAWLLLWVGCWESSLAQGITYQFQAQDILLTDALAQLEASYNLRFSYAMEEVAEVRISGQWQSRDLSSFIEKLLRGSGVGGEVVGTQYIILRKVSKTEKSSLVPVQLCGQVIDSATNEPLPFASVFIPRTRQGVNADADGKFVWIIEGRVPDSLMLSYAGYRPLQVATNSLRSSECPRVSLAYQGTLHPNVTITDYLSDGIDLSEAGAAVVITPSRLGALPGQVVPDLLRAIQFLPGVSSPSGELSELYLRGGTPDQTVILWEDIPIYHTAHYFGMVSAFNANFLEKAKVYRGGFGAEYGGRVAGIIDLRSVDHTLHQSSYGGSLNGLYASTFGKIVMNPARAVVSYSLRRSVADIWLSPTFQALNRRTLQGVLVDNLRIDSLPPGVDIQDDIRFLDGQVKLSLRLGAKNELSASGFGSANRFVAHVSQARERNQQDDSLRINNWGASVNWRHTWTPRFSSRWVAVMTGYDLAYQYGLTFSLGNRPSQLNETANQLVETHLKWSNEWLPAKELRIQWGLQWERQQINSHLSDQIDTRIQYEEDRQLDGRLGVGYVSLSTSEQKRYGGYVGLRASYFAPQGTGPGSLRGGAIYLEPRLRLWARVGERWRFHAHAGRYRQFISQLLEFRGSRLGIEMPLWILTGSPGLPILAAYQYQLGALYESNGWLLDAQGYYKTLSGLSSLSSGFELSGDPRDHVGNGQVIGVDLLIKKRWKFIKSWVSYSLSRVIHMFPTFRDTVFPAGHDQRHQLRVVNLVKWKRWEGSIGWTLRSGLPYTEVTDVEILPGPSQDAPPRTVYQFEDGIFQGQRLAWQHQLDASLRWHVFKKQASSGLQGTIGISWLNVYDQVNMYERSYFLFRPPNRPSELRWKDYTDIRRTPNVLIEMRW